MATPAKKLQESNVLKNADKQDDARTSTARRIALTPARRDEITDRIAVEWKETFDLLERYDNGELVPELTSN